MKPENISYIKEMMGGVCHDIWIKCMGALLYVPYVFLFDSEQHVGLTALLILIIFDMITGIASARYTGEIIKSSKILRTVLKICFYYLFISAGHLTENVVGLNLYLDETILAVLALTELISIMENIGKMGYAIPMKLLNKLHELRDDK